MKLSQKAQRELVELAGSGSLRKDMKMLRSKWRAPFINDGEIDLDAYIEFVIQFNEFINHQPKPLKKMIDRDMRL